MRITVLGGCGAWPAAGQACSGYLVEHDGYHLLIDPGYATLPRLLEHLDAADVDAVLVTHGHPDHCADLNPLLRARVLSDHPPAPLPAYAPAGALDAVLALDTRMFARTRPVTVNDIEPGHRFDIGPFTVDTRLLPHYIPNAGVRLSAGGAALAYTGDCGPDPGVVELARDSDLLIADATYVDEVSDPDVVGVLGTAREAGLQADAAGTGRLVLTHLWPGTDPESSLAAARAGYAGPIDVARAGLTVAI
ncbi:MAG TPA: MBL fold metallo-hydrolase [Jatrophihabitantaceae bacterium]|jgi:ribonuclease BN (tRNA processing enzyme)